MRGRKDGFKGKSFIMQNFINLLKTEIKKDLPGIDVQWFMSSYRMLKDFARTPGKDSREAAVLILLYPSDGSVHTVLMQRPEYEGVHSGQISFPGGKKEASDVSIIQTAVREANEETGVDTSEISVIGTLTPLFIPLSNMIVTPVVGWDKKEPLFQHLSEEVVFLIDADLRKFMDPAIIKTKPFEVRGETIDIKYFDYDGYVIWGATAMILYELLTIIKRAGIKIET